MAFSSTMLPENQLSSGGGYLVGAQKNINALTTQNLTNAQMQIANQFAPGLNQSKIAQQQQQANYLQSEAKMNAFLMANPQYKSPEGWLYSQAMQPNGSNNQSSQSVASNIPRQIRPGENPFDLPSGSTSSSSPVKSPVTSSENSVTSGNPQNLGQATIGKMLSASNEALSNAEMARQKNNLIPFTSDTPDGQTNTIAQFNGAGLDPMEGVKRLANGESMNDIMQSQGYAPGNWPAKNYLATKSDIDRLHTQQMSMAGENYLSPFITAGISPYAETIKGKSPSQVYDAIKNDDPEKQANFLASVALQTERNAMRGTMAGLHMGKGMVDKLSNSSLSNISSFQSLVKPAVYTRAQQLITQQLNGMVDHMQGSLTMSPVPGGPQNMESTTMNVGGGNGQTAQERSDNIGQVNFNPVRKNTVRMMSSDGKLKGTVPNENQKKFLDNGWKVIPNG